MAKKSSTIGKRGGTGSNSPARAGGLSRNALLLIVAGIVLVFALVIVVQQASVRGTPATASQEPAAAERSAARGPADAKVTVMAFEDFQCPHCKDWSNNIEPRLFAEYVDTGQVRFEYKNYIVISRESADAGNAAECAAEQGYFWPYHDILFSQQGVQGVATVSKANLKLLASGVSGIDANQFNNCVDGDKYIEQVYRDMQQGNDLGVTGTPSVFVNGKMVSNSQDYTAIKAAIDAALAAN